MNISDFEPISPCLRKKSWIEIRSAGEEVEDVNTAAESPEKVVCSNEAKERVHVVFGGGKGIRIRYWFVRANFGGHFEDCWDTRNDKIK